MQGGRKSEISSGHEYFDFAEAVSAGDELSSLKKAGQLLGVEDVLIASTALSHHCVLVTANIRHFSRVDALRTENWLEPAESSS